MELENVARQNIFLHENSEREAIDLRRYICAVRVENNQSSIRRRKRFYTCLVSLRESFKCPSFEKFYLTQVEKKRNEYIKKIVSSSIMYRYTYICVCMCVRVCI